MGSVIFILRMQGFFNTQKSINIIYYIAKLKSENYMNISIDAERALD